MCTSRETYQCLSKLPTNHTLRGGHTHTKRTTNDARHTSSARISRHQPFRARYIATYNFRASSIAIGIDLASTQSKCHKAAASPHKHRGSKPRSQSKRAKKPKTSVTRKRPPKTADRADTTPDKGPCIGPPARAYAKHLLRAGISGGVGPMPPPPRRQSPKHPVPAREYIHTRTPPRIPTDLTDRQKT
jgi:hypothetical protein